MLESPNVWEQDGRIFASARFEGSKKGIAAAEAYQASLSRSGWELIDVQTKGGGTDVARSLGKSALGLGLLGATGFGFLGTSRRRGEITTTYEKVGPSESEIADENRRQAVRTSGAELAVERSALFSRAAAGRLGFQVRLEGAQVRGGGWLQKYSVDFTALVGNQTGESFEGFELEVVLHDEAGRTVASDLPVFNVELPAGAIVRVTFSIGGLSKGDVGALVAVRRVMRGGEWREDFAAQAAASNEQPVSRTDVIAGAPAAPDYRPTAEERETVDRLRATARARQRPSACAKHPDRDARRYEVSVPGRKSKTGVALR